MVVYRLKSAITAKIIIETAAASRPQNTSKGSFWAASIMAN